MTEEHFTAIVQTAEAKKDAQGWFVAQEGRHLTLYASSGGGSSLTVSKIEAVKVEGRLLKAKSVRGEVYVLSLEDVFAGAVEPQAQTGRRAGFG